MEQNASYLYGGREKLLAIKVQNRQNLALP